MAVQAAAREEAKRLMALTALDVLDSAPEAEFDRITAMAAKLFGVPMALISLVDADRQWFKSAVGLPVGETPRHLAFCNWAIRSPGVFVVLNALRDPRFASNPLVTAEPNIVFYAGAPLQLPAGEQIGTVCVLDRIARARFDRDEQAALAELAAEVVRGLIQRACSTHSNLSTNA
jgi:GAF domain-containing protein